MKISKILLTILVVGVVMGGAVQSHAVIYDFDVDSSATWNGYRNSFTLGDVFIDGEAWGVADVRSTFLGPSEMFLQSNVNWADDNPGSEGTFLFEGNTYQEITAAVGDTATFDFYTVADTLTSQGYSAIGFIKVLDGFSSWATTQFEWVDLTAGSQENLSLIVESPGAGTPILQAGFAIKGPNDYTGSGIDTLGVTVIPEPATLGLIGFIGGGLFLFRRLFMI